MVIAEKGFVSTLSLLVTDTEEPAEKKEDKVAAAAAAAASFAVAVRREPHLAMRDVEERQERQTLVQCNPLTALLVSRGAPAQSNHPRLPAVGPPSSPPRLLR